MKRFALCVVLALALALFAACAGPGAETGPVSGTDAPSSGTVTDAPASVTDPPAAEEGWPEGVYLVKTDEFPEASSAHAFDVEEDTLVAVDESRLGSKTTVEFAGNAYEAEYTKTITYVIGDYTVDEYSVVSDAPEVTGAAKRVRLLPDGTLVSVLGIYVRTVELPGPTAGAEAVRAVVEAEFSEDIDFSRFEFCDADMSSPDLSQGFGAYSFTWYNKRGDIPEGSAVKLMVSQTGEVSGVKLFSAAIPGFDDAPENLTEASVNEKAGAALRALYGDALTGFETVSAELTRYCGQSVVDCLLSARIKGDNGQESCLVRLLVSPKQ